MRTFKNYVSLTLPNALCHASSVNEEFTDGNIEDMGKKLAIEVKKHITDWCFSKDASTLLLDKLTFIGHSLGGIIIRSALPHLESYK